jgi:hypothetical protein
MEMSNQGKWKVHMINAMDTAFTEIYIYRETERGREIITDLSKMIVTSFERGASTVNVEPTIKIDWGCGQEILQALADALYGHGIKPEGEPVLKNELSATKYHLEDMRKLMFETVGELVKAAVNDG